MTKFVYIGGFGQSGTTLFEYLITANPAAVACGEIVNGFRKRSGKELRCSCGKLGKDCPIWGAFKEFSSGSCGHEALVGTLLGHVEEKYAIMSDSSKTTWGSITAPFRLRRKLCQRFYLLHIVRDPRAVCWSAIRLAERKNSKRRKMRRLIKRVWSKPIPRCVRTALGWWIANLSCELFGWLYREQYLRIQYENVARCPRTALYTLFNVISPELELRLTEIGANDNRHQLYGNRMRRRQLLFSNIRLDVRWKSEMPSGYRRLTGALTWPLRARYYY